MPKTISGLTPTEFENFTYDLIQSLGMKTVVWRTPGADGGRDIEATFPASDFSGHYRLERWYIECKHYKSSIDWPTIWQKVAYADARGADFLLLVTNNNPSPNCENEIASWNRNSRNLQIRVWRGYEIAQILLGHPSLATKYGLRDVRVPVDPSFLPLITELMKIFQANYVASDFGKNISVGLELASSLSELISSRLDQVNSYNIITIDACVATPDIANVITDHALIGWDEITIRTLLLYLLYVTRSETIDGHVSEKEVLFSFVGAEFRIEEGAHQIVVEICQWSNFEVRDLSEHNIRLGLR